MWNLLAEARTSNSEYKENQSQQQQPQKKTTLKNLNAN